MIAHDDVDDPATARIARWLDEFRETPLDGGDRWWEPWTAILERSAELDPTDDRAIVRDNRPLGYPTLSTLICVASLSDSGLEVHYGEFADPGAVELGLARVTGPSRVGARFFGDTPDVVGVSRRDCAPNPVGVRCERAVPRRRSRRGA